MRFLLRYFASQTALPISPGNTHAGAAAFYHDIEMVEKSISPEALQHYRSILACFPLPVCLVDRKGFIHSVNQEFLSIVQLPCTEDCPFLGRFLLQESSDEFRQTLDALSETPERFTRVLNIAWLSSCLSDQTLPQDFLWTISGGKSNPVYLICARCAMLIISI